MSKHRELAQIWDVDNPGTAVEFSVNMTENEPAMFMKIRVGTVESVVSVEDLTVALGNLLRTDTKPWWKRW